MHSTVQVLNVFLASPDDLKPEREAAEELVKNMNKHLVSTLGWQIVLLRWEDAVPSYGRPQGTINKAVDECALFIGMLWERWGQQTGEYSSGFEEEYERALARRKRGSEPEIWMVFKAVDPSKLKDPGSQLNKVLSFRDKQRSLNEILYREVTGIEDWKGQLQNWLWAHVAALAAPAGKASQPQTPVSFMGEVSDTSASHLDLVAGEGSKSVEQLLHLADSLKRVIKSGNLEFSKQDEKWFNDFDVARIALLAATWMSQRQTGETLGTHEVNLLYKYRDQLETTPTEEAQLFRTVVAGNSDVIPGWFWFRALTQEDLTKRLLWLARRDSSAQVRARAISLLRTARIELPKELRPALPLTDDAEEVRNEVYEYLGLIGDESTAASLANLAPKEEGGSNSAATEARLSILLRLRPEDAFAEVTQSERYVSDDTIRELQLIVTKVSDEALLKGARNQWEQIRKFCVTELARRRHLPKDLALKLTEDPSVDIREAAYIDLARQGVVLDFDKVKNALTDKDAPQNNLTRLYLFGGRTPPHEGNVDAVILAFFGSQDASTVLKAVDWFNVNSPLAYESLATDHYAAVRDDLRSDLENGFVRIKQQSIEEARSKLGEDYAEKAAKVFSKYEDFIQSQFTEAALSGLVANGESADIRFGRQYLANDRQSIKLKAVRIVSKFGTEEDVPSLLEIWRDSWGDARDEAGSAALRLSKQPFEVAQEFIRSTHERAVREAFDWLYGQDSAEVMDLFAELLESESATDREKALYFFSKRLDEKSLSALLEGQFDKGTYYYNVVTWLDRLLYAPEPLPDFSRRQLEREATPKYRAFL
jgi:HEAT repeat protein